MLKNKKTPKKAKCVVCSGFLTESENIGICKAGLNISQFHNIKYCEKYNDFSVSTQYRQINNSVVRGLPNVPHSCPNCKKNLRDCWLSTEMVFEKDKVAGITYTCPYCNFTKTETKNNYEN